MERDTGIEIFECADRGADAPPAGDARLAEYRRLMMTNIDKIRLMHRRDFYAELHTRIESNFKSWKKRDYAVFVYFITFKIDNMDEIGGVNVFENIEEGEGAFRRVELARHGSAEDYYHALLAALALEDRRPRSEEERLVVFFRERMELRPDQLEALVKTATDKIARLCPRAKIAMIFCALQHSNYTLCGKALYAEEIPFSANEKLVFEALHQFVKQSQLPWPVAGPRWIGWVLAGLGEYAASLEANIRQWLTTGELVLLAADPQARGQAVQLDHGAPTARYHFGLRLLRACLKQLYPQSASVGELWLHALAGDYQLHPRRFGAKPGLEASFHTNIREFVGRAKYAALLRQDAQLRALVDGYAAQQLADAADSSRHVITLLEEHRGGVAARAQISGPLAHLNKLLNACIGGYFTYVDRSAGSLFLNSAEVPDTHLNPDIRGELYLALSTLPVEAPVDRLRFAFFEALCAARAKCAAAQLFEQFCGLAAAGDAARMDERALEDAFLYQLCVFEHLGLLRLDRRSAQVEKFVFKKFR